ncbi:amino acid permease C-terminal domain-containing protein, partial [Burkholderia pseudomallei]
LRRTHTDLPRAFRCPGVPLVPILAVAACLLLMLNLQPVKWIAFLTWLVIGLFVYFAFSSSRS